MATKQKTVTKGSARSTSRSQHKPTTDSASVRALTLGFTFLSVVFAAIAFLNYG